MRKYDKYIKTKNIWFPELPSHWILTKVKYVASTIAGGTPSTDKPEFWENGNIPWLPSGKLQNCDITTAEKFITEEGLNKSSTKWIKANTTLIALTGATCANIGYLRFKACANQSVVAIDEVSEKSNSRFMYYMFLSMRMQILIHQSGGAQAGINDNNVKNLFMVLPSLEEQTKIAQFLDHQTTIIDELIQQKEKLIELLKEKRRAVINEAVTRGLNPLAKMKDSGIEWLGEVPIDWALKPLKLLASLKGRLGWKGLKADEYVDNGFGFLSTPDIKNENIDFKSINYITEERYLESPEIMLEKDDILLVKDGSTLGIVNYIRELPFPTTVNSSIGIIRIIDKNILNPEYLLWQLKSDYLQTVITRLKAGQGVPHLFQKDIKNFKVLVPSVKAQSLIVEFIKTKSSAINQIIEQESVQIERLKEYRQSIISEAVTGKIDVREWQPHKQQVA